MKRKHNYWTRREGNFDMLSSAIDAVYTFHLRPDAPRELGYSVAINIAHDPYIAAGASALDVARVLLDTLQHNYVYHGDTKRLEKIIEYLEPYEQQDEVDSVRWDVMEAARNFRNVRRHLASSIVLYRAVTER